MPGFDGTGPIGMGPITGQGLGNCIVPIGNSFEVTKPKIPYAGSYAGYQRPFGLRPYVFNLLGMGPYRLFPSGGRGRRSWVRGRFFGFFKRGQGTRRRYL